MMPHLMVLEARLSSIPTKGEAIGLDEDDVTGIAWFQMPIREWDETGFTSDPVVTSVEILNQFYYSGIII